MRSPEQVEHCMSDLAAVLRLMIANGQPEPVHAAMARFERHWAIKDKDKPKPEDKPEPKPENKPTFSLPKL